jgi:hypothetical protein
VAEAFAVRIQAIARQYSQGRKVDAATASPAELLGAYLMGGAGSDPRIEVRGKAGEVD